MSAITKKPVSSTSRGKDYGYGNARVRGMRSHLLGLSFYEELIQMNDLSKMITKLSETGYGPDLEEQLLHGRTPAQVDEALRSNMVRTFQKVIAFLDGEPAYLMTTMLGRWDLFNIKTIIRGKHLQMAADEIETNLIPAGQFSQIELSALTKLSDVRAVVDTLVTWGVGYAEPLKDAVVDYVRKGDIAALELALDRYHSMWAAKRLAKRNKNYRLVHRIVAIQVDTTNLMTAMRLQKADIEEIEPERFFLPGGLEIDGDLFVELTGMSDIDEMLERLKRTSYGPTLGEQVINYVEVGSAAVFERALEDYLMRKALVSGVGDPLGAGVLIGYLWAKHNEVTNLRIIVKGLTVGMPEDRVRKELILV